jgi:mRNA interferase HigB
MAENASDATWRSLAELRQVYPHADPVGVASGRTVVVFNIRGNRYRLITAIHYNRQVIYTLRFLTHAEYSKDRWKETL